MNFGCVNGSHTTYTLLVVKFLLGNSGTNFPPGAADSVCGNFHISQSKLLHADFILFLVLHRKKIC